MSQETTVVPRLGLGTWQNDEFDQCAESVRTAIDAGYRHVDTAESYENERGVGAGVASASTPREDVFLATKILHPRYVDGQPTRESIRTAVRGCLDRLDVAAVDLLYVHWPCDYDLETVHTTLADCRDDGLVDRVGVSNYLPRHLEAALDVDPEIVANQVEFHPLLHQSELLSFCDSAGVDAVAYAPFAHGRVFDVPELETVAEKYDVSVAQVTLAWLFEKGLAAVPKATGEAHIRDNLGALELELDVEDVDTIDEIDRTERVFDPDYAPDW